MFFQPKQQHVVDFRGNLLKNPRQTVEEIIKPRHKTRRFWFFFLIFFLVVLGGSFTWIGGSTFSALGKIVTKNQGEVAPFLSFLGNIQPEQLKGEGDSRINILLLGIGGAGHPGGQLADTIMVVSLDPKEKAVAILSIPRDLYVPIPGYSSAKINSAHSTGEQNKDKTSGGAELTKKTVAVLLDLPIHYYLRADFTGFIKLIDALDGIVIDVPKAISDPFYPDEKMEGYEPFYIKSGQQTLDGETALKYSRSRETTSDFDRARRQQEILLAVKDKAWNLGVLANPKKITDILKILGEHVRTDLQPKEMERLLALFKEIDPSKIVSRVLDNTPEGLLTTTSDLGGYFLIPKTGVNNFKEIQRFAHEIFSDPYLKEENAKIEVLNASQTPAIATEVSKMLKSYGYNIIHTADSEKTLTQTMIYDYTEGQKPFTIQFLSNRLSAKVVTQPKKSGSTIDISILLGNNYQPGMSFDKTQDK